MRRAFEFPVPGIIRRVDVIPTRGPSRFRRDWCSPSPVGGKDSTGRGDRIRSRIFPFSMPGLSGWNWTSIPFILVDSERSTTRFSDSASCCDNSFSIPFIKGCEMGLQCSWVPSNTAGCSCNGGTKSIDGDGSGKVTSSVGHDNLFTRGSDVGGSCADVLGRECCR